MKNRIFIILQLCMIAATLLLTQGCKEDYEMVNPPLMTEEDDLDEEVMLEDGLSAYYVTQFGEGNMDGSSWEQAMDVAGFRNLLSGSIDLSESTIYMSQGKYVMSEESGPGVTVRKDIKAILGGYSPVSTGTDVSNRDPKAYETVISGDVNGNKQADQGDCGLLVVRGGNICIDGVTFQHGFMSEEDAAATDFGSGIYVNGTPANTIIELNDCIIKNCKSTANGGGTKQGGSAIFALSGQIRLTDIQLTNNESYGRGGAIRTNGNDVVLFMNRCSVKDNMLTGDPNDGGWGLGIQVGAGTLCMNNTTVMDNTGGSGGAINSDGSLLLINSTFIEHADDYEGVIRYNATTGCARLINNLVMSEGTTINSINSGGNSSTSQTLFASNGYNFYQRVLSGFQMADTDIQYTDINGGVKENGMYVWDVTKQTSITVTYATQKAIITAAKAYDTPISPITNIGEVFAEWVTNADFAVDQRGEHRNPDKMQAGAYDAGLK